MFHLKDNGRDNENKSNGKTYTPIDTYKPSGLIYNETLLKKIEDKTRK
jgi:hypothetical protein